MEYDIAFIAGILLGFYVIFIIEPLVRWFIPTLIMWSIFGLIVFLNGAWVHWKIYLATNREKTPLIQTIALLLLALSFIFDFLDSSGIFDAPIGNIL